MRRSQFFRFVLVFFLTQPLWAGTYYVGNCESGAYSTIRAAVAAASAGSTILLCPATYSEQVIISKPLNLRGISYNNSSQPVIAVPNGGLATTNSILLGTIEAQLQISAAPVRITNVTVDGSGLNAHCPNVPTVGIFFSSGSSGSLAEIQALNQECPGSDQVPGGLGVLAENGTSVTESFHIIDSNVHNSQWIGIATYNDQVPSTLTVAIENNSVTSNGTFGIFSSGVSGVIDHNVTAVSGAGIVAGSALSAVNENTVTGGGIGISIEPDPEPTTVRVVFNFITNGSIGGIGATVSGAIIEDNMITQVPIGIEFNCETATVTGNLINGATTGMDQVPAPLTGINKVYNVATLTTSCS